MKIKDRICRLSFCPIVPIVPVIIEAAVNMINTLTLQSTTIVNIVAILEALKQHLKKQERYINYDDAQYDGVPCTSGSQRRGHVMHVKGPEVITGVGDNTN